MRQNHKRPGPPNPYGKRGGPEHQAKIEEIKADLKSRRYKPVGEYQIDVQDGKKKKRYVDVVAIDEMGEVVEYHQVGKRNKKLHPQGTVVPVKREQDAIGDIEKTTGKKVEFHPYN
jgi:hypothetical protein